MLFLYVVHGNDTFAQACRKKGVDVRYLATRREALRLLAIAAPLASALCACSSTTGKQPKVSIETTATQSDQTSSYIVAVEDEPDTVDFQCTSIHYTVAINAFNRLVETEVNGSDVWVAPSLAESWSESSDGRTYTFHLRDGVTFSNGSPLTSHDVLYTFCRLLTHPDSCNRDIADPILGADELASGTTDQLEGFTILSDRDFSITLKEPFEAFLACLSMPGASILDEQSTEEAGTRFGKDPKLTIGTGSFVLTEWHPGQGMKLAANEDCWEGRPNSDGLDLRFMSDPQEIRNMFEQGALDILDLDELDNDAEFFLHGDSYHNQLYKTQRIGITYFALNESVAPLDDARVRRALQLALDRSTLLDAVYNGFGTVEHGLYPHGLYGYNPDLPEIPYDPGQVRSLLEEAGYAQGFDLEVSVKSSSTRREMDLVKLAVSMWDKIGVHAYITILSESDFMRLRKTGELACYTAMWTADYDDPDTFAYTFFGNRENTTFRSICYARDDIMERVRRARTIVNSTERLREYHELERIIAQEDAAWIPLFSRLRVYVTSKRAKGIQSSWNGSVKTKYREIAIDDES